MDILYAFIQAETWAESRRILEAHPELLSEEADALIKRLIENAQQENDEEKATLLNNHRIILNHSRKWCMTSPRAGRPKTSTFKRCCGKPGSGVLRPSMCGWIVGIRLLRNLKLIASFGWFFRTRLKSNRLVNPDRQGNSGGGNPTGGAGGASEGLWARPGISDGFPKRGRGILGDQ